ncbi:MAG: HlyD family efflux transporter periplasmic adaptor subunit [Lachnospiraceae bacterium]|nr:HlyD family efflux transporter periplasmic adaptor subunit [Lachnospiraceae bacterium]
MPGHSRFDIHRLRTMNIGTIVFGILFIYIVLTVILYITTSHVASYRVVSGPLAKNRTYTGVAVYSEHLVSAGSSGYIDYYAQDSARIRKGGVVYGVSATRDTAAAAAPDSDTLKAIKSDMEAFSAVFDPTDFHDTYSLKYKVENEILNMNLRNSLVSLTGSMTIGSETVYTSESDEIITYTSDGMEDLLTRELTASIFDEKNYRMTSLKAEDVIRAGDPVYRVIESEDWSLLIPLTARQIVHLDDTEKIRVRFTKDGNTQTAAFSILTMNDGTYYGKLDFTSGLIRYLDNRYIDVELVTNTAVGLKIPVSSIITKSFYMIPKEYAVTDENGDGLGFIKQIMDRSGKTEEVFKSPTVYYYDGERYYIGSADFSEGDIIIRKDSKDRFIVRDTAVMQGVYSMNKGYAVFRRIEVIDKNEDYCIVKKGSSYGIAQFDNIVEDASAVRDSQITAG